MEKCRGGPGKIALLIPLSHDQNRGGGEGGAGGPGGSVAVRGVGERERAPREVDSRPQLERGWSVGAWPRRREAAGDGGRGGATARLDIGVLELGSSRSR